MDTAAKSNQQHTDICVAKNKTMFKREPLVFVLHRPTLGSPRTELAWRVKCWFTLIIHRMSHESMSLYCKYSYLPVVISAGPFLVYNRKGISVNMLWIIVLCPSSLLKAIERGLCCVDKHQLPSQFPQKVMGTISLDSLHKAPFISVGH